MWSIFYRLKNPKDTRWPPKDITAMEKTQPLSDHPLAIDAVIAISHTLLKSISNNSFIIKAQLAIFEYFLSLIWSNWKRSWNEHLAWNVNFQNKMKFFVTNWDSVVDLVFETDFSLLQMYFASKDN